MSSIKKRRREGKTNYSKRLKILRGERPRIVVRKTNKYIVAQYVKSFESKDSVEIGLTSKKLLKYGWPKELGGSLKSIPATYLTGLLLGKMILEKDKNSSPIIDFGIQTAVHKSRIYSFIKGIVDSGLEIKYKKETLPESERVEGRHMKKDIEKVINDVKNKILKN
ncbi:MAG: 50S ribosomal protein L18 [Nanoarchaeota archaeon]